MKVVYLRSWITILTSFGVGLILTVLPLPSWAVEFRPTWLPLILFYWLICLPFHVGLGMAFGLGLLLDGLNGSLLGEHALVLVVVAYVVLKLYRQIRMFPLWQQSLVVAILLSTYHLLLFAVCGFVGQPTNIWFVLSVITSTLLWPWLSLVMRDLQRRLVVIPQ